MADEKKLRCVVVRVGQEPTIEEVDAGLHGLRAAIRADMIDILTIWILPNGRSIDIVCDDEGRLNGSAPNRAIVHPSGHGYTITPIFGDLLIAGHDGEGELISLTQAQAEEWRDNAQGWMDLSPGPGFRFAPEREFDA